MEIVELDISGCYLVTPEKFVDDRGGFVKTFLESQFNNSGIEIDIKEEFYSVSKKGVVRGIHFQSPPHELIKMVYCPKGAVFDAYVDLRKQSPTYLQTGSTILSSENAKILILAAGIGHGFCSLEDDTLMVYKTSSEYRADSDSGVLWNSCGIEWPSIANPKLISIRDQSFVKLDEFDSPFEY